MDQPPLLRRLGVVAIDLVVLGVIGPIVGVGLGVVLSGLFSLTQRGPCQSPCDGPSMAGFGLAFTILFGVWVAYWPVLILVRRQTIGSRMLGLRFDGTGLHRRLVYMSQEPTT